MEKALVWSYGGGTQSVAIAVLIVQGRLPKPDLICIADTGREASETWEYTDAYVRPLLARVGLRVEVAGHGLATVDLYSSKGELLLPAFSVTGKLPTFCSSKWKARVVQRWLRDKGVKSCMTWIGISLDEIGRMKDSGLKWLVHHYPLVFDVPLRRWQCRQVVIDYGLPEPPRSSCWMCPHRQDPQWLRLKEHYPQDWEQACALDDAIREQDQEGGVYLHKSRVPLREARLMAEPVAELPLFGQMDGCDGGFCWV